VGSPSFSIRSTSSDRELVFSAPRHDRFLVELRGSGVGAIREVYAYTDPTGLSRFLSNLAAQSRPWVSAETWESLEGEFRLSAECSPVGHVSLSIRIRDMLGGPEEWQLSAVLATELGQLPAIAEHAKSFFESVASV
jgi:hypothetical protein